MKKPFSARGLKVESGLAQLTLGTPQFSCGAGCA